MSNLYDKGDMVAFGLLFGQVLLLRCLAFALWERPVAEDVSEDAPTEMPVYAAASGRRDSVSAELRQFADSLQRARSASRQGYAGRKSYSKSGPGYGERQSGVSDYGTRNAPGYGPGGGAAYGGTGRKLGSGSREAYAESQSSGKVESRNFSERNWNPRSENPSGTGADSRPENPFENRATSRPENSTGTGADSRLEKTAGIFLNSADTTLLKTLPGIGSYTASRIVSYRESLGGFVCLRQLDEIKGLRSENLEALRKCAVRLPGTDTLADWRQVNPLPVDSASLEKLMMHPYVSFYQAKAITQLRQTRKTPIAWEDLDFLEEFTEADRLRLKPYWPGNALH